MIHRTDDDDDKLIVCDAGPSYTGDDIRRETRFREQLFQSIILR